MLRLTLDKSCFSVSVSKAGVKSTENPRPVSDSRSRIIVSSPRFSFLTPPLRAMELLIDARTIGFFQDAANVIHLKKTDTDLDPLRERDDFKKSVETLKTE